MRDDAERIDAGRVLEEQVQEIERHERHVFNPAISEFIAMMNQVDEVQELRAKIAYHQALDKAYRTVGKSRPNGMHVTTYDVVLDALLAVGATHQEIEQILLNPQIGGVITEAQEVHNTYGKGCISVIPGNLSGEEYAAEVAKQEYSYDSSYFAASLDLFADAAIALDNFATQNPRLAELSMTALDIALSGPSRFMLSYCSRELGIEGKIDECKEHLHGWLSAKLSDISGLDTGTSEVLVSGGMFGTGFAFALAGIQPKDKILADAKKVAGVKRKIGDAGKYGDLTDKIRPKGGFNDGLEAHHMPSKRYLEANKTMNPKEGFSAMMSEEQHSLTRTYQRKAIKLPTSAPYRHELAEDLTDYIGILKTDGSWTPEVRRSLQQGLDTFRREFPDLFRKIMK